MSDQARSASYASDRCLEPCGERLLPCALKRGHKGGHLPVRLGARTTADPAAASDQRGDIPPPRPTGKPSPPYPPGSVGAWMWMGLEAFVARFQREHGGTMRRLAEDGD